MDKTSFQVCQKIVVFDKNFTQILLAKRKGEADYDGVFSFIGGKIETTDGGIVAGLKREKTEEISAEARLMVYPRISFNEYYQKKSGQAMILPHFLAIYQDGDIIINEEYSEYKWVMNSDLDAFEPKIETVSKIVNEMLMFRKQILSTEGEVI